MHKSFIPLITPILSCCILTLGNGFYTTLTTVQLTKLNFSTIVVGIISAVYFAGMLLGSLHSQTIISKVRHIRAYSVFAALMSICCLFQGVVIDPWLWGILRFICGYALAGLFIVIESWCISSVDDQYKGRIMGLYLFAYYLAQTCGQFFLKINYSNELVAFCIIAGFACFSIIPVSLTRHNTPQPESPEFVSPIKYMKIIPLGLCAAFIGGVLIGSIYTMLPLAFKTSNFTDSQLANIMAVTILGGMIFQLPIGKLSDSFDRRKVILGICISIVFFSILICIFHKVYLQILIFSFFIGSGIFTIYPISISHSSDLVDISKSVIVISIITLFFGLGSMLGPLFVTIFIDLLGGINGFFIFTLISSLVLGIYTYVRILKKDPVDDSEKVTFTPTTSNTVMEMKESIQQSIIEESNKNNTSEYTENESSSLEDENSEYIKI